MNIKTNTFGTADFDWSAIEKYDAKRKKIPNLEVLEKHGDKI